jgi:hypothetical protein
MLLLCIYFPARLVRHQCVGFVGCVPTSTRVSETSTQMNWPLASELGAWAKACGVTTVPAPGLKLQALFPELAMFASDSDSQADQRLSRA